MSEGRTGARTAIRVAIADERRLLAESLAALLRAMDGFTVLGAFAGEEALTEVVAQRAEVLLVALGSCRANALDLVRSLRRLALNLEVVILADDLDADLIAFVLDQRVNGLLSTDTTPADLAVSLDQVVHGHAVLPADWQSVLARKQNDPLDLLSRRQLEVLKLVAEGLSYEDIGGRLFISPNTVKFHLRTIYLRLGVRNRVAAARLLTERGDSWSQLSSGADT
jgi:two-component system, NarL family, nitrate/nitrite response regulator NarP